MTKHTPGPWDVSRDAVPEWHKQFTVYSEQGERVATAFLDEANARLIAAAPEMLEALRKVRSYNEEIILGRINYRPEDHIAVIDAAIALAVEAV